MSLARAASPLLGAALVSAIMNNRWHRLCSMFKTAGRLETWYPAVRYFPILSSSPFCSLRTLQTMDFLKKLSISDDDSSAKTSDGLIHKLSDAMKEDVQPPSSHSNPAPQKEEHLLDKLSSVLGHSTPPPPPAPKHDGLLGKIGEVVGHVTNDNTPQKPHTLEDKINNMLGGGAKGEAKEDVLDKGDHFERIKRCIVDAEVFSDRFRAGTCVEGGTTEE